MQQPWPWIAFALADMFIQMNIKRSFSFGLLLFFSLSSLLTKKEKGKKKKKATSSFDGTIIFFN